MNSAMELKVECERELVKNLLVLAADRASREQQIESRHATEISTEQQQYRQVFQLLTETYEAESESAAQAHSTEQAEINDRWESDAGSVQSQYDQKLIETDERWSTEMAAAQKERDEAGWLLASLLDGDTEDSPLARLQVLQSSLEASRIELDTTLQTLDGWCRHVTDYLQKCRLLGEATAPKPSQLPPDLVSLHQTCVEAVRQAEPVQRRVMRRFLPRLFRGLTPLFVFLLAGGVVAGAILLVPPSLIGLKLQPGARDWQLIAAGAGSALSLVLLFVLHLVAARRSLPDFDALMQLAVDADAASQRWTTASRRDYERQEADLKAMHEAREKKREAATAHADGKLTDRVESANSRRDEELRSARSYFPERLAEIEKTRTRELQQLDARYKAKGQDLQLRREQDFRNLQAEYDARVNESRQQYQQSWLQLIRDWHGGLSQAAIAAHSLQEAIQRTCPDWSTLLSGWLESRIEPDNSPDVESPEFGKLSVGRIITDLRMIDGGLSADPRLRAEHSCFQLPVLVSLADKPSLIVHSRGSARGAATEVLQTAMLRYLTSLPPGKVRFTVFDPVGLGANFASFMHLADIDELMVTSRIWTEPSHIEKRLADLTEHMETVLQTYLRNEYATLDDYNHAAGEVAEPYRILVVANFPANFTELALRRLMSIVEGGVKCGVFVLLSVDESLEMPRGFSLTDLEDHATVLRLASAQKSGPANSLKDLSLAPGGSSADPKVDSPETQPPAMRNPGDVVDGASPFRLADPVLGNWPLIIDKPPAADDFGKLVRLAGQLAKAVRRVEVPFARVMPSAEEYWTFSTRAGIDVPIGRAGATKLQQLRLGKGTSQHVLIAGKTGSGKSSLLHAFITNAALQYNPDELEFYLIDFKKGVEFKTYASNQLPHARVIAIESDREFGVSVLQRLDTLLKDRGDLYRQAGVQDLAGFREARPDEPMPRVVLVIDEFQEFFTEDDSLSQSAALLFDRLIRQGRAFGVHVILGSQTLAGAYSLARSTLGQIAVRIALQCSDADAHLILSEENTAARLLTRPGEAIYNDANGLVEGNHPFQVVWLDDAERETYLEWMRGWAPEFQSRMAQSKNGSAASGEDASRWPKSVVFEGNIPADPLVNPHFVAASQRLAELGGSPATPASSQTMLRSCWLGEAVALTGPTCLEFGLRNGGPMLVIGRDDDAAVGVFAACILALAGQGSPSPRFVILDGSLPDSFAARTWQALFSLIPTIKIAGPRDYPGALQEVVDEIRAGRDELAAPIFVIVFDMARFRDLKKADDEFGGFGGFDKAKTANPSSLFADVIKDGPASGVFPFAWCDGYQTAQRWLGRELLNRFETRILFAMNANDSSNLIDSPAAGRLGPNRALLYRGDVGTLDKFRPYKAPPLSWLTELRTAIAKPEAPEQTHNGASAVTPPSDQQLQPLGTLESTAQREPTPDQIAQPTPEAANSQEEAAEVWTDISDLNIKWG